MDTKSFFAVDFNASLFPLKTNLLLIEHNHVGLEQYIAKILSDDPAHITDNFLPQQRVHAAKPNNHLRRTVVLDPVASYFLYDLVLRNRDAFGIDASASRQSFGYKFKNDHPVPIHKAYRDFNERVATYRGLLYEHSVSFDIASYFNSIYHHDATNWFASLPGVTGPDGNAFGRFFRETNAGRSIDFLPQGIYPAKMIGSEFLRFIELSGQIKCAHSLRFMDDIYLFDNSPQILAQDFLRIQELLGLRALNINPTKTLFDGQTPTTKSASSDIHEKVSAIIQHMESPSVVLGSGFSGPDEDDNDSQDQQNHVLDDSQIESLLELLVDPKADEANVELILTVLHEQSESVMSLIPGLIVRFPNIVKQLYKVTGLIAGKDELTNQLINVLKGPAHFQEYQLFWIGVIAEDHLTKTKNFPDLILRLYEKTACHKIARAKILEIPDQTFGLKEIRDEILKSGMSDWLSWAAAIGTRTLKKAERNHALKYFSKGSPLNYLIFESMQSF